MADESTSFKLDLDSDDFVSSAKTAQEAMEGIGNVDLGSLLGVIEQFGPEIALIAAAVIALKSAFDAAFDAENIKAVNEQFNIFAESAGVVPQKLKEGLLEASKGWVDETTLMQAANQAMVGLQISADKLPDIMTLALKATQVFGGTAIDQFNKIAQAVESGNTRALRSIGINVDKTKAERDYAASIGVTSAELSKAGQQQALLNAVLGAGQTQYKDMPANLKPVTSAWMEFKAAIKEVQDTFSILTASISSGPIKGAVTWLKDAFTSLNIVLKKDMGEGMDGLANKSTYLAARIGVVREQMMELQKKAAKFGDPSGVNNTYISELQRVKTEYNDLLKQNSAITAEIHKQTAAEKEKVAAASSGGSKNPAVDPALHAEQVAKYNADIEKLNQQLTADELKNMQSVAQATALYQQKQLNDQKTIDAQIAKIDAEGNAGKVLTRKQADAEIAKLEQIKKTKAVTDEAELLKLREQALQQYLNKSTSTFQGIERGFQAMSQKNALDLKNFGAIGTSVSSSFGSHMTAAFTAIGNGSQSATQAMGAAFEGMVGQMATQYGEMMFLASIYPPNPVGLAGGAALMILGGALGAASSGATAGVSTSAASSATVSSAADTDGSSSSSLSGAAATANPQKSVSLVIQGNMLMSDQSQRWLVDQIRNASDATDFKIQSIGGGL